MTSTVTQSALEGFGHAFDSHWVLEEVRLLGGALERAARGTARSLLTMRFSEMPSSKIFGA